MAEMAKTYSYWSLLRNREKIGKIFVIMDKENPAKILPDHDRDRLNRAVYCDDSD